MIDPHHKQVVRLDNYNHQKRFKPTMVTPNYLLSFLIAYDNEVFKAKVIDWLNEESSENILGWLITKKGFNYVPFEEMPLLMKLCSIDLGYYVMYEQWQQSTLLNHIVSLLNDRFIKITEDNIGELFDIGLYMTLVSRGFTGQSIDVDNYQIWQGLMRIDIDASLHIMAFIIHYYKLGFMYRGRGEMNTKEDIHSWLYEQKGKKGYFFPLHYYKHCLY